MMKCNHWLIIISLLVGFTVIAGIGWVSSIVLIGDPQYVPYLAPITVCMTVAGLVVIRDSIVLQGGSNRFFCGGKHALINFLRRRPRPPKTLYFEGPYGVARHPVYSASITIYLGIGLVLPWMLLSFWILLLWIYVATIVEEYHLKLNPAYQEYTLHTPRLSIIGVLLYGCKKIVHKKNTGRFLLSWKEGY